MKKRIIVFVISIITLVGGAVAGWFYYRVNIADCEEDIPTLYQWKKKYEDVVFGSITANTVDDVQQTISNLRDLDTPLCLLPAKWEAQQGLKDLIRFIEMSENPNVSDTKAETKLDSYLNHMLEACSGPLELDTF